MNARCRTESQSAKKLAAFQFNAVHQRLWFHRDGGSGERFHLDTVDQCVWKHVGDAQDLFCNPRAQEFKSVASKLKTSAPGSRKISRPHGFSDVERQAMTKSVQRIAIVGTGAKSVEQVKLRIRHACYKSRKATLRGLE